jgi:hypothetical protein
VLGWPKVSRQALNKRAQKLAWRITAIRAELEVASAVGRREISARWVVSELRQIAVDNKTVNPAVSVKALHLLGLELGMFAQAPGHASTAPGSAFNPNGNADTRYAGTQPQNSKNPKSVSQYDVAGFQQSHK